MTKERGLKSGWYSGCSSSGWVVGGRGMPWGEYKIDRELASFSAKFSHASRKSTQLPNSDPFWLMLSTIFNAEWKVLYRKWDKLATIIIILIIVPPSTCIAVVPPFENKSLRIYFMTQFEWDGSPQNLVVPYKNICNLNFATEYKLKMGGRRGGWGMGGGRGNIY